ncbi:hypothetical protein BJV82DRAFT_505506 [Fennellomyces sp. T-0311]|nr:hypothetical protein BJV82DRAFT_505506 [Fennellomyces sp. T-0311]
MAGTKRTKGSFDDDYYERGSSSKRVRFKSQRRRDSTSPPADIEFDHEDALEPVKKRRGQVNTEELSDDEEVGGGVYSSGSDDDESDGEEKGKGKATAQDDDDFDMFGDAPAEPQQKKSKGKRRLDLSEIEGQELDSRDVDSEDEDGNKEPKLTAFNMRQEMEEGSFDQQGNYHVNKADPQAIHDRWLEGVSRKDMARAKDAQIKREQAEAVKEAERQANVPQTKTDVYRELVKYLKPGETVGQAIGKLSSNASTAKVPKWKQKLMEKKNRNKKQTAPVSEADEAERQRKVERLTELADQMMALGHFGVYDDSFEEMVVDLRRAGVVPPNWMPGDDAPL